MSEEAYNWTGYSAPARRFPYVFALPGQPMIFLPEDQEPDEGTLPLATIAEALGGNRSNYKKIDGWKIPSIPCYITGWRARWGLFKTKDGRERKRSHTHVLLRVDNSLSGTEAFITLTTKGIQGSSWKAVDRRLRFTAEKRGIPPWAIPLSVRLDLNQLVYEGGAEEYAYHPWTVGASGREWAPLSPELANEDARLFQTWAAEWAEHDGGDE